MASIDRPRAPAFWKELYWFVVICLFGVTLALAVIPPRASRLRRLRQLEAVLEARQAADTQREEVLKAAIESAENDPFYRDAVYRKVLGVKRDSEEFLNLPPPAVR